MPAAVTFALPMKIVNERNQSKPVAVWLLAGVFLIIVQIILGGITRLTDSGLSITEWQPILGTIPPTSHAEWQKAFDEYKQIAQFKHLHSYFTLEDFKSIYFWEWFHRVWGRLIGVVFLIPFIIFLFTKSFSKEMVKPLLILFLLGGLQGLIGWIMVQSGLNDENLYVSHIRLAIHFIVALVLLVYTFWFALQLLIQPNQQFENTSAKNFLLILIGLLVLQLVYGAFMAGLRAATSAPTWPSINGQYFPDLRGGYTGRKESFASSLVNNPIAVHFIHRNLAYIISVLIIVWTFLLKSAKGGKLFLWGKWLPFVLVLLQVLLGIFAVLTSPTKVPQKWGQFEWFALLHQFVAMLLLLSLVFSFYLMQRKTSLNFLT